MDILTSPEIRLSWTILDDSLDKGDVTLDGHPITPADLNRLNQPVHLKTANLVLNLGPIKDVYEEERIEFPTGHIVTPLQILGAIYTYYNIPMTIEEIDRLIEDYSLDTETDEREAIRQGKTVPRSKLMEDEIFFEELQEKPGGSFIVGLGS